MSPAGTVDLSLPTYGTLVARAGGVDPRAEARRVAGADPSAVQRASAAFGRAGGELDTAWTQSMGAADTLGSGFTNGGAAVLDRATHVGNLPPGFGDAGTRLAGVSRRLGAVAEDLSATMADTATAVAGLDRDLATMQSTWFARVAAAATDGGLIPQEAVPGLLAERDRVVAAMTTRLSDAGRAVTGRIATYETVINDAVRLLGDQGLVPPAALDLPRPPPPAPAFEGEVDPSNLGVPLTAGYAADPVNTALGNFVEVETDLPFAGLLAGLTVARTYNSRDVADSGSFGTRWSSWATTRLVEQAWTADYAGPDGQRIRFPRVGTGFDPVVGIHARVERRADGLTLAWFDGRRWDFDAAGRLARTEAGPGTAVAFVHAGDRLVELVHERGRRVRLEWDGDRVAAVTASDGRRVEYRYADGRLVEVHGPAGSRHYGHDDAGYVASVTDADGVTELVNTYDGHGRVLTQRSPFGRTVTFSYAPDGVTVVADDSAGPRNTYRHDPAGRLVAATDGHGRTQHTRYDDRGNPVEIVERGGGVTRQEFDDRAHPVRRVLPSGAVQEITWDERDRVTAVTTAGAQAGTATTRLHYEGAERSPSRIVDPEGATTRLQVADGLVHALTDPDGVTVRLRHDADGNLVEAVDAAGGVARVERDAAGRPTAVTTPAGRRTELVHDAHGRLVARRDPAGGLWRHEYTAAGRLAATVDPTGARTETRHGPHGLAAELVDALGAATTLRYDDFGNLADVTAAGAKWTFRHDALSRLTAWTDAAGGTWLHEHDADGRRVADVDPTGVRVGYTRDVAGRLTGVDDGLVVTGYRHDELGRPVAELRADGTTRALAYDRCGRVTAETGPDGGVTRSTYSPAGRVVAVVSPTGREERLHYDDRGRPVTRIDGTGGHWRYRYDPDGLLTGTVSPTGLVESLTRDAAGRVVRHRVPGVGTTAYAYDAAGRVVAVTDRHGRRALTRDPAGRVVAATDALGHTTRYTWDERGHLVAVTDPLGGRTVREHDPQGRLVGETDPLGRTTRFTYDAAGRLRAQHDPTGAARRWTYDGSGRPARLTAGPGGATAVAIGVERDALGRPVRVTETGAPDVALRWDAGGRLVQRRRGDRAVGWSYDRDGLRTALTHPDGTRTDYRRDGAGRVTGLHHPLLGAVALDRDPDGRLRAMTGAGAGTRWTYRDGWLTGHETAGSAGTRSTALVRDEHGRVVAADTDGRTRRFSYDPAGQLTGIGERGYTYDPCGRLHTESGPAGERRHTYDAAGQLTSSTGPDGTSHHRHDGAGRRVADDGAHGRRHYRWDALGRPTGIDTVAGGRTRSTALRVDALGELAEVGDVPLAWDSADPFAPLVGIGAQAVVGHGHPWALADAATGEHRFLDPDWQHGVGARADDRWRAHHRSAADDLGGADELGGADRGAEYAGAEYPGADDPWGAGGPAGVGAWLGYRGELVVDGLVWLRERAYDPATRAFLAPDPLPPVPGTAYAANPYHYAGNDPVNSLDPLGLRPMTDAQLEGQRDSGGGLFSSIGHGVLDVVGLVPGVGAVADGANAVWYAAEGDYTMAALSAAAAVPFAGLAVAGAKGILKGARAAETVAPTAIRFSQTSVNDVNDIVRSMRANGWVGDAIDVVRMPDGGLTTVDNTRVLAAHYAGIDVRANIHSTDEALSRALAKRFTARKGGVPGTWGDAVLNRIGSQNLLYRSTYPHGSPFTGWKGD